MVLIQFAFPIVHAVATECNLTSQRARITQLSHDSFQWRTRGVSTIEATEAVCLKLVKKSSIKVDQTNPVLVCTVTVHPLLFQLASI